MNEKTTPKVDDLEKQDADAAAAATDPVKGALKNVDDTLADVNEGVQGAVNALPGINTPFYPLPRLEDMYDILSKSGESYVYYSTHTLEKARAILESMGPVLADKYMIVKREQPFVNGTTLADLYKGGVGIR